MKNEKASKRNQEQSKLTLRKSTLKNIKALTVRAGVKAGGTSCGECGLTYCGADGGCLKLN